ELHGSQRMTKTHRRKSFLPCVILLAGCCLPSTIEGGEPTRTAQEAASSGARRKELPADPVDQASAGHFAGRVLGLDDKPLPHARIFIAPDRENLKSLGAVRAETDADGRFAFVAPDMTYTELDGLPARRPGLLVATAEGYAPDWMYTW